MASTLTRSAEKKAEAKAEVKAPAFDKPVAIIDPNLPSWEPLRDRFQEIYSSRMITNSNTVREFERRAASYLNVEEAVAMSSCTLGLILTMKALGIEGEVIVPSFTFSATGHAVYWAGARPVFVDIDENTWNISVESIKDAISPDTGAILAVHIFGNPADVEALEKIARDINVPLIFDAAHAFGASVGAKRVGGFGTAEVFSLSPTKLLTGGEGGLVATNDASLAQRLRLLRNYGDSGNYDCFMPGLNARMNELSAAIAVEGLSLVDSEIAARESLAEIYRSKLGRIPGIHFQHVAKGNQHSFKDFTIAVEPGEFGLSRDELYELLLKENINTKKYFYPPLHWQTAYRDLPKRSTSLEKTEWLSTHVLTIPLYSRLKREGINRIADVITEIHENATGKERS